MPNKFLPMNRWIQHEDVFFLSFCFCDRLKLNIKLLYNFICLRVFLFLENILRTKQAQELWFASILMFFF